MDDSSLTRVEVPVLTGKVVNNTIHDEFTINRNTFVLDIQVHNFQNVPTSEKSRVRHAVAAAKIFRCPAGQYKSGVYFDSPHEIYVKPESSRIRVYVYDFAQLLTLNDLLLLRMLVPGADQISTGSLPLYSAPSTRNVTVLVIDLLTEEEITRRERDRDSENAGVTGSSTEAKPLLTSNEERPKLKEVGSNESTGQRKRIFGIF